ASDSQVDYGTTVSYGSSSPLNPALVTSHSVALSGLTPSTLYHYRVRSRDASGGLTVSSDFTFRTASAACVPPVANPVLCENSKAGNPSTEWDLPAPDAGDPTIQGFANDISFNRGDPVTFKVSTPASAYSINIYRMGYYGGTGARKIASVTPSATLPQTQPA